MSQITEWSLRFLEDIKDSVFGSNSNASLSDQASNLSNTTSFNISKLDVVSISHAIRSMKPLTYTYILLIVSAIVPIYAGAHASLSRPSTAAKPPKKRKSTSGLFDDADDEDESSSIRMESMRPSDAILLPIFAGITLTSLYVLIKWLQDPSILNKILNVYFASFSIVSVARLVGDALDVVHSFAFPAIYRDCGLLFRVDGLRRRASPITESNHPKAIPRLNPLPGPFSRLQIPTPINNLLWFLQIAPQRKFTVKLRLGSSLNLNTHVQIHQIEGFIVAVLAVAYYNIFDKPWLLTNLLGFGFSYAALQLLSPTTFTTGSMLLAALFVYDIYMVFYTPMMVTVAKGLDIPAKMEFPRPGEEGEKGRQLAMLGLGDIVLPGVMIGLALRFDLWLHYLRLQSTTPVDGAKTGEDDKINKEPNEVSKPTFRSPRGHWGSRSWTSSLVYPLTGFPYSGSAHSTSKSKATEGPPTFKKTYFTAAMIGYILGLLTTLVGMQVSNHPQPALLYLVPGVLGSIWLTATVRGDLRNVLDYTELDDEDKSSNGADKKGLDKENSAKQRGEAWASYFGFKTSDSKPKVSNTPGKDDQDGIGDDKSVKSQSVDPSEGITPKDHDEATDSRNDNSSEKTQRFFFKIEMPPPLPNPEDVDSTSMVMFENQESEDSKKGR